MGIFSPLLLSISSNLDTFRISNFHGIKKVSINKLQIMIISIITTIATFFSMFLGKILKGVLLNEIVTPFGCMLLIFIGIYFFVEYIRMKKKSRGEDTSYYVESNSKFSMLLNKGDFSSFTNSIAMNFKNSLILSFSLSKTNILFGIIAGLLSINIPFSIFLNFIVTIITLLLGEYIGHTSFSKFITKYSYLMCGFVVILLGLYEYFL